MRDPKRIKSFLKKLEKTWLKTPDMRFGQLIVCILSTNDPFYIEDDVILSRIDKWVKNIESDYEK